MTTLAPTEVAASTPPVSRPLPGKRRISVGRVIAWIVMVVIMVVTLAPFYWIIRTALSSNADLLAHPSTPYPVGFSLDSFKRVFGWQTGDAAIAAGGSGQSINFWLYLRNSVIVSCLVTAGTLFFSAMAAYAFSRLKWRLRGAVFAIFLAGLMVPGIFTFLPNFVLIKELHLVDTLLGIALPGMLISPFAIFFLRQFFLTISTEVEEAALIDGASKVGIFFRLILPMSSAPLITLGVLTYISSWNDYFWPLMVSYTDSSRVLTVALAVFKSQTPQTGPDWAGLMAATLVAALPMLVLFLAFAKRIVNSIGFSGLK